MFNKEYSFTGIHADKVKKLTAQFDKDSTAKLFSRNIDVYIIAPLIGFLYGRKEDIDKSHSDTTKIFPEQLIKEASNLKYNYQLIMLLDEKNEASFDERLDKAFRHYGRVNNESDKQLFEKYVRGGVDVLYEKLIEEANSTEDYIRNLYDFIEEFHERYNEAVSSDIIMELCALARN